jgi:hypothetical protein
MKQMCEADTESKGEMHQIYIVMIGERQEAL